MQEGQLPVTKWLHASIRIQSFRKKHPPTGLPRVMFFCYSLTESSKSPASIARSNKQLPGYERSQGGTRLRNLVRRDPFTESRKEGSVYGKIPYEPRFLTGPDSLRAWIPYEPGFLMILQVAKRIANIRFT